MKCNEPYPQGSYEECQLDLGHRGDHEYFGKKWARPEPAEAHLCRRRHGICCQPYFSAGDGMDDATAGAWPATEGQASCFRSIHRDVE